MTRHCSCKKIKSFLYCNHLQHLRDVEQESAWEKEQATAIAAEPCDPTENCENEESESSSSSSYDGDLSEQDDVPFLGDENVAINKATQVKAKVKSRKSQAVLGECLKCAERKLKIRALQKQNGRLRSQSEKWKEAARRIKVRASLM